ncbi:hypothetical protein HYFRA_00001101 [Hymenoscyphus fraxineus]|uniref:Essential protein Yae1 N-terminal domain-containing protein n=1 Tax=Hymenoscyphus fraxineus TaxID=746836 RepID=A0A9N9PQQ9_9HELO|nr:hypothetical protein HYFRA_00001101 [Hymenoscyphus fraxineus]
MPHDTFDEVLGLEEEFYNDGYKQGLADGIAAGRIEGRKFGLEKGFEKYVESGRLYGKSLIWANRLPQLKPVSKTPSKVSESDSLQDPEIVVKGNEEVMLSLPPLQNNQRLVKHVKVLHALAESESLSTENSEDAVADFDDRFKRALAKAKIIERMVGEGIPKDGEEGGKVAPRNDENIEDASTGKLIA